MSWLQSLLRAFGIVTEPLLLDYGAEYAGDYPTPPEYDALNASVAPTKFSWIYATAVRRAAAMASLPIRVYRNSGGERALEADHWLARLIEQPTSVDCGEVWRRDLVCDLLLSGNAYVAVLGPAAKAGVKVLSLPRWHPEDTEIITDRNGISAYVHDEGDGETRISPDRMCHVRMPSFRRGKARLFYGVGMVQPLHDELEIEDQAIQRSKEGIKRGRPDVIISPKAGRSWIKEQRDAVAAKYSTITRQGGGAIVAPEEMEVKPLSWTPRDTEAVEARRTNRESILASSRVPPVAVGLETANYATAREQDAQFWLSLLDDARLLDAAVFTRVLRIAGETDTVAMTDFSGVKALQTWRNEAVQRATSLALLGVPLEVALENEGLVDVVHSMAARTRSLERRNPRPRQLFRAWWRGYHLPDDEEARAARWAGWMERVHRPSQNRLAIVVGRALRQQAKRLAEALPRIVEGRSLRMDVDQILSLLWNLAAEQEALESSLLPTELEVARKAVESSFQDIAIEIEADQVKAEEAVRQHVAEAVTSINVTTRAALREVLVQAIEEGDSVGAMQARIQDATAFGPGRSLLVARTETTRTTKDGTLSAYREAVTAGVSMKKQWLSSRGEGTRDEHWALDRQIVGIDEPFTIPESGNGHTSRLAFVGMQADGPGGFTHVAMIANCTCSLLPVVENA